SRSGAYFDTNALAVGPNDGESVGRHVLDQWRDASACLRGSERELQRVAGLVLTRRDHRRGCLLTGCKGLELGRELSPEAVQGLEDVRAAARAALEHDQHGAGLGWEAVDRAE